MSNDSLKTEIEATTEVFSEFGFTRYDSLVLSILTAIGTATVKEIHQFTDVPLPKVYQTLENLVRKGFVKQHSKTRPVEFTAYAPKIIMRKIEEENRKKELKLKSSLDRLAEHTQPSFTGDIVPFSGLENFLRIGEGLISNATKHISFAGSAVTLGHFADELRDAKDRGVKLRSMIISQLSKLKPELNPNNYQNLGFNHRLWDIHVKPKLSLDFYNIIKGIVSVIDYVGILIADNNESIVLLPLFPNEMYFGIWIYSNQIIKQQLFAYDELYKISSKTD